MRLPAPDFLFAATAAMALLAGSGVSAQERPALPEVPGQSIPDFLLPEGEAEGEGGDGPPAPDAETEPKADAEAEAALIGDEPAAPPEFSDAAKAQQAAELDQLFAELAEPEGELWIRAESDIQRIWTRSGSAVRDLLYKRGEAALDAGDSQGAIAHLTALTDHAPDFASGWYLRSVAYYLDGDFGPALADLARTLELEPRYYPALTQLGAMLEEVGEDQRALDAFRASLKIHPHQSEALDSVSRLDAKMQGTDA